MPSGSRQARWGGVRHPRRTRRPRRPRCARGFTYLLLLFVLALLGAALAAWGSSWQVAVQRERETELLFRGVQIQDALQRFHDQTPSGQAPLPQALDELLADTRWPVPRFHLRRLYADPFTGQADWALLRDASGGIVGVHSRSQRPALRQQGVPMTARTAAAPATDLSAAPDRPPQVGDWRFSIQTRGAAPRKPR